MASLRQRRNAPPHAERYGIDDYQAWIQMSGATFPVQTSTLLGAQPEALADGPDFTSIYKSNGIVFACMAVRQRVFSQITFRFAALNNGKVGKLFGGPEIDILSKPWPNGTTGDLATRMITDADSKGAFFGVRHGDSIYRRDPLKMWTVLSGNPAEEEFVDILGYSPLEVLTAVTQYGGQLLGLGDIGMLKPGWIADVLVVEGNPAEDVRILQDAGNLRVIMQAGRLHKAPAVA